MRKKAQVLIISLWILAILAMLSVSIGRRVSMALRLSRYQKERLRSAYFAQAGINIAIGEIEKDKWADNQEKFAKISLDSNINEFATVSSVIDEERKININTATQELLTELLNPTGA